ncbi:hypothetical protein GCM10028786_26560 [Flaviaesturariibacter terrae]
MVIALSLATNRFAMKKYLLVALAGVFAVGTVAATAVNADKGKKKKAAHSCCQKMGGGACSKSMKSCAKP